MLNTAYVFLNISAQIQYRTFTVGIESSLTTSGTVSQCVYIEIQGNQFAWG